MSKKQMIKLPRSKKQAVTAATPAEVADHMQANPQMSQEDVETALQGEQSLEQLEAGATTDGDYVQPTVEEQIEHQGEPIEQPAEQPVLASPMPTAPKKAASTVTVVIPFKAQSPAYIETVIEGKQAWLAKSSLIGFDIEDDMVTVELPRTLARRRKLIEPVSAAA